MGSPRNEKAKGCSPRIETAAQPQENSATGFYEGNAITGIKI
jgi:hypothetical protein